MILGQTVFEIYDCPLCDERINERRRHRRTPVMAFCLKKMHSICGTQAEYCIISRMSPFPLPSSGEAKSDTKCWLTMCSSVQSIISWLFVRGRRSLTRLDGRIDLMSRYAFRCLNFAAAGPRIWNSLLVDLRQPVTRLIINYRRSHLRHFCLHRVPKRHVNYVTALYRNILIY